MRSVENRFTTIYPRHAVADIDKWMECQASCLQIRLLHIVYIHNADVLHPFKGFSFPQTETTLCRRFTVFVTKYNLMSRDNLIVPILEDESAGHGESEA